MSISQNKWDPLNTKELIDLLKGYQYQWILAGGYAIECFVGKPFRPHGDIDILINREDQLKIKTYLSGWELFKAVDHRLYPWTNEYLSGPIQDIWCRPNADSDWKLQIMLFDVDNGNWIYKRNRTIKRALATIYGISTGFKYLLPEIQLLYKAKIDTLEKDQIDFDQCLPLMSDDSKKWLCDHLKIQFPNGHDWIDQLSRSYL